LKEPIHHLTIRSESAIVLQLNRKGLEGITFAVLVFFLYCTLVVTGSSFASSSKMKGPGSANRTHEATRNIKTSSGDSSALLCAIKFYKEWISPIGGRDRCGFRPSCSSYGYRSIEAQGPLIGVLMTADRLIRCNIWKKPGPDYTLLPNGKLYDPPSKNLLFDD
jgi:putative membrane protein insertion efficiency factor